MLYRFIVCRDGGLTDALFEYELKSDKAAGALAFMMLSDHPDAHQINVWQSERFVLQRLRGGGTSFGAALHSPE